MPVPFLLSEQARSGQTLVQKQLASIQAVSDEQLGATLNPCYLPLDGLAEFFPLTRCPGCGHPPAEWALGPWRFTGNPRPNVRVCLRAACGGRAGAKTAVRGGRPARRVAGRAKARNRR